MESGKRSVAVVTLNPFPLVLGMSRLSHWKIIDPAVTPLMKAAENGNVQRVQELLASEGNVNATDQRGYTVLIHACMASRDEPELVRLLLSSGADLRVTDRYGRNALLWSIFNVPKPLVINELVKSGANVNVRDPWGNPALFNAAVSGGDEDKALEAVKILMAAGAELSAKNADGQTALAFAIRIRRFRIAEFLKQSGATLTSRTS
jgi:ankyrin repeat protein